MIDNLNFENFLEQIYQKFPQETLMILGQADASPESGIAKVNHHSYSINLLPNFEIKDSREFDRAALGLKAFFEIITQQNLDEWGVKKEIIDAISKLTFSQVKTQDDLYAWSYAILFNDLGKLHISNEEHQRLYGQRCADHDLNMVNILKRNPQFYPNFTKIDKLYQNSLVSGLGSGFNLGKAVKLECPAGAWTKFLKLSDFDQQFHLGHCLFDFIGVSGANDPRKYASYVMNDEILGAFMDTIECHDHYSYAIKRLEQVGLSKDIENSFPIARLIAMARVFDKTKKDKLLNAISSLNFEQTQILFKELNNFGTLSTPAIELQYIPAILDHVINYHNEEDLSKTLLAMIYLFDQARQDLNNQKDNLEIYTFNLIDLATEVKLNCFENIENISQTRLDSINGGWKWIKSTF